MNSIAARPDRNEPSTAFWLPIVPYLKDCLLLRATGRALALPLPVVATGLVYLHRCRRSGHPWTLSRHDLICGCLYAAAKAEEVRGYGVLGQVALLELPGLPSCCNS
jgi:hypothetical protein